MSIFMRYLSNKKMYVIMFHNNAQYIQYIEENLNLLKKLNSKQYF